MTIIHSQNLNPSQWTTARYLKRTARSDDSPDQNITGESWMDGLSDDEIMFYQNFALSSKIYPDKLDLLLKGVPGNFGQNMPSISDIYLKNR